MSSSISKKLFEFFWNLRNIFWAVGAPRPMRQYGYPYKKAYLQNSKYGTNQKLAISIFIAYLEILLHVSAYGHHPVMWLQLHEEKPMWIDSMHCSQFEQIFLSASIQIVHGFRTSLLAGSMFPGFPTRDVASWFSLDRCCHVDSS